MPLYLQGYDRGIGVRWLRILTLVLLNTTTLYLAWQISVTYGAPVYSNWDTQHNSILVLPIIAVKVVLIAAQGLYDSRLKHLDYLRLIKALTFSHLLLLMALLKV